MNTEKAFYGATATMPNASQLQANFKEEAIDI